VSMHSTNYITKAAFHKLPDAVKIRHVNMELLQFLTSSLRWILRYCHILEKGKITVLIDRAIVLDKMTPL
jgi:hypothetical protein